jgi:hypothetical protein
MKPGGNIEVAEYLFEKGVLLFKKDFDEVSTDAILKTAKEIYTRGRASFGRI